MPFTSLETACDKLVEDIVNIDPEIWKDLDYVQWTPLGVCALVAECQVDCCLTKTGPE